MPESDKRYYDHQAQYEASRKRAVAKARNRGVVAENWEKAGNKLTAKTMAEFRFLMKKADKDFENNLTEK